MRRRSRQWSAGRALAMASIVWETPDTPITTQDFVLRHGKRFVKPYFFEFKAHVKERWNKKTIVGLFADEFRQRPHEYYVQAVNAGRIVVNGEKVTTEYHVRTSQTLSHFVHRHEPPVMDEIVEILELTPDVVIVCKPSSVPVHACGQYRKNTVLGLLEAEHKLGTLYPIHRLDRLVSGLLILARNSSTADRFRQEIEAGTVTKSYIAKVRGVFPEDEVELNAAVVYCPREGKSTCEEHTKGEKIADDIPNECNDSILSYKGKGKSSITRFKRLYTDGLHSIVECMPLTGRTHQIRVHLQYLGHPIANDALYADPNPPKRTEAGTNAERAARLINKDEIIVFGTENRSNTKRRKLDVDNIDILKDSNDGVKDDIESELEDNGHDVDFLLDPLCTYCPKLAPSGYETDEEGLWLHCKTYSGKGWKYECPLPKWAKLQNSRG